MFLFIGYFIVGFLQDMLATIDVAAVFKNKPYLSASMGTINTILGYCVFGSILINIETRSIFDQEFITGVITYAVGGGAGTIFAMKKFRST